MSSILFILLDYQYRYVYILSCEHERLCSPLSQAGRDILKRSMTDHLLHMNEPSTSVLRLNSMEVEWM